MEGHPNSRTLQHWSKSPHTESKSSDYITRGHWFEITQPLEPSTKERGTLRKSARDQADIFHVGKLGAF